MIDSVLDANPPVGLPGSASATRIPLQAHFVVAHVASASDLLLQLPLLRLPLAAPAARNLGSRVTAVPELNRAG